MLTLLLTLLLTVFSVSSQELIDANSRTLQLDVPSSNLIILDSSINYMSVEVTLAKMKQLEANNKEIYLKITSPGGSVIEGARLAAFIRDSKVKVTTICEIYCASMGAIIHQYGHVRYMIGYSLLMLHPATGGVRGTMDEMKSFLGVLDRYIGDMDKYIQKRSKLDWDTYKNKVDRTYWMTSSEAIEGGFSTNTVKINIQKSILEAAPFSVQQELERLGYPTEDLNAFPYIDILRGME